MVSRIEFFCPGCGAPEVPELILREYYNCPNCHDTVPRDKLDRQRRNNYLLAGTIPSPFIVTLMGAFADSNVAGITTLTSPTGVSVTSGEMFIACVCQGGAAAPTSVTVGADAMTLIKSSTNPVANMYYFNGTLTNAGLQTVVANFAPAGPSEALCCMLKVVGAAASPIDKTAQNGESVGLIQFTLVGPMAFPNELMIGCTAGQASDVESYQGGISIDQRIVNASGFFMHQFSKQLVNTASVLIRGHETGTDSDSVAASIKPR